MKIDPSWKAILHLNLFNKIINTLKDTIPPKSKLLVPFSYFPLNELKIVILGEEPYPNPELSNGLAFSVNKNIKIPQSINNIFKEINHEYKGIYTVTHGDLSKWASREKILLLNTSLTISKEDNNKKYWREYTDIIIKELSNNTTNVCFLLMGNHAKNKRYLIDEKKHFIVECIHPSPNSASRGFFGSNVFKLVEEKLEEAFNWSIYE